MKKRILHLPVKSIYFYQIKNGTKLEEFRLQTDYWKKRLINKVYDEVHIKLGYPKKDDLSRIIIVPWNGFVERKITHEHFGDKEVSVFAIKVG